VLNLPGEHDIPFSGIRGVDVSLCDVTGLFRSASGVLDYDRPGRMMRRIPILVILLAALFAAEPLLHSHPLGAERDASTSTAKCVVCASGTSKLPSVSPSVAASTSVAWTVEVPAPPTFVKHEHIPAPSRGPPAV
jgi:hypothetical protein